MKLQCGFRQRRMAATIAAALGCIALAGGAWAEDGTFVAPVSDISAGSDSDGFHSLRLRLGVLPSYENTWSHSGAVVQSTSYSQGEFRKDVAAVLGIYRDQRRDTLAGIDVEAGVARVSGHLRPVGEMTLRLSAACRSCPEWGRSTRATPFVTSRRPDAALPACPSSPPPPKRACTGSDSPN